MYLRFSMAGDTVAGRAGKNLRLMTPHTIGGGVLPFQGPDSSVIKVNHAVVAVMAGEATVAKLRHMRRHKYGICLLVTVSALGNDKCKLGPGVAGVTGKGRLIEIGHVPRQAKASIAGMVKNSGIERGRGPAIRRVAGGALQAKQAAMLLRFLMAGGAVGGRPFKNAGIVAGGAGCFRMETCQSKSLGVIFQSEVCQGIQAIVASQTVYAKIRQMRFHELGFFLFMAVQANGGVYGNCALRRMAGGTA